MFKKIVNFIILTAVIMAFTIEAPVHKTSALNKSILQNKIIILDAGHGLGNTNTYAGYDEQAAMLKLAQKIKNILEAYGATVYMTRSGQNDVSLPVRAAMINKWALQAVRDSQEKANATQNEINEIDRLLSITQKIINSPETYAPVYMNYPFDYTYTQKITPEWQKIFEYQNNAAVRDNFLVISLHSDSSEKPVDTSIQGATVYYSSNNYEYNMNYYTGYSNEQRSYYFGEHLLNGIEKLGIRKRRTEPECFFIIREHNLPCVLVENGFHTNAQDRAKLSDDSFLEKLALVYADTVAGYFTEYENLPQSQILEKPEQHYISRSFTVYKEPSFTSDKVASFSPQTITIYATTENGWALISTHAGKYWAYIDKDF